MRMEEMNLRDIGTGDHQLGFRRNRTILTGCSAFIRHRSGIEEYISCLWSTSKQMALERSTVQHSH
jgi:hypothetical protein